MRMGMARQLANCLAKMTWISLENDIALPPIVSALISLAPIIGPSHQGLGVGVGGSALTGAPRFPKRTQPSRTPRPRVSKVGIHIQLIPPIHPLPIIPPAHPLPMH